MPSVGAPGINVCPDAEAAQSTIPTQASVASIIRAPVLQWEKIMKISVLGKIIRNLRTKTGKDSMKWSNRRAKIGAPA